VQLLNIPWSQIRARLERDCPGSRVFQFFGFPGSGRTFVLLYAAAHEASENCRVVIVDCSPSVSSNRLAVLVAYPRATRNITLFSVRSAWQLLETVDDLDLVRDERVVVFVDNLLESLIVPGSEQGDNASLVLSALSRLRRIGQHSAHPVLFTNEARTTENKKIKPFCSRVVEPYVDVSIIVERQAETIWLYRYDSASQNRMSLISALHMPKLQS
jgi:RecA/RadA recombinase